MRTLLLEVGGRLAAVVVAGMVVVVSSSCVPDIDTTLALEGGAEYGEADPETAGSIPKPGDWWKEFDDPGLGKLMVRLREQNPSAKAALGRYDQARATLGLAKVDKFPVVDGEVSGIRYQDSAGGVFVPPDLTYNEYRAALNLSYEVDLWGRVRHSVAVAQADLEASAADLAAVRLSLEAELARDWFQWRYVNEEIRILTEAIEVREQNRKLVDARVQGGEANELDLERARTELEVARAQSIQLERERARLRHALAILVGEAPSQFSMPDTGRKGVGKAATIPSGVPSELLARRPDIASAERRLAAAASRVDVVQASFLPKLTLTGVGGASTLRSSEFFDPDSLFGNFGPDLEIPVFEGGRLVNEGRRTGAAVEELLAVYAETVLAAFREVEDALSDIQYLDREIAARRRAVASANAAAEISRKRYQGGLVSYLEVVDAERTLLNEEVAETQALSARHLASVQLVRALGGGWEKTE